MDSRRVLIVDANADTAELMACILSPRYVVRTAQTRSAAIEMLTGFKADVIVAEYFMADMPFSDFLEGIRNCNSPANIILSSAIIDGETLAAIFQLAFLSKPFYPNRLLTTVARSMMANPIPQVCEEAL